MTAALMTPTGVVFPALLRLANITPKSRTLSAASRIRGGAASQSDGERGMLRSEHKGDSARVDWVARIGERKFVVSFFLTILRQTFD